jgi:NADH-quinone oxidoreductase subunit D
MGLGASAADTGAFTMFVYCFDLRERIIEFFESLCGSRLTYNYVRPGGVSFDLPEGWLEDVSAFLTTVDAKLEEMDKLFFGNVIARGRMKGIGVMSAEDAVAWGLTGPVARGSGVNWDLRKHDPYSVYPLFDFDVVVGDTGDSYDRGRVKLFECYESAKILRQAIAQIPGGRIHTPLPRLIAPPPGDAYDHIESARGTLGVYLVSDGSVRPYRMHVRSPAFCNLAVLPVLVPGHTLSDLIVVLGSLDPVFGEVDR